MADERPRRVGKSALTASPLGFGTGPIGSPAISNAEAVAAVEAAWHAGARFFDTAPWYGVGRAERRLGFALAGLAQPREEYRINTKVGRTLAPERERAEAAKTRMPNGAVRTPRDPLSGFRATFDYSGPAILAQHEASLHRLGTAYVDSLVIHDLDYGHHSEEQVEQHLRELAADGGGGGAALRRLRDSGAIRAIGVGCNYIFSDGGGAHNAPSWGDGTQEALIERIADLVDLDFIVMAGCYTLLETCALRRLMRLCDARDIGVVIASPFSGGLLVDPGASYMYAKPSRGVAERAERMRGVCRRHGAELPAAALQFVLAHPRVACVIPGAKSAEEARANARHLRAPVPAAVWRELRNDGLLPAAAPVPAAPRL